MYHDGEQTWTPKIFDFAKLRTAVRRMYRRQPHFENQKTSTPVIAIRLQAPTTELHYLHTS